MIVLGPRQKLDWRTCGRPNVLDRVSAGGGVTNSSPHKQFRQFILSKLHQPDKPQLSFISHKILNDRKVLLAVLGRS